MGISIGVDTGGTFVDIAVMDDEGSVIIAKSPTTPQNYLTGVMKGLELAARQIGLSTEELLKKTTKFIYGTTIATNYILEGKGRGRAGLIVTKGFKDTLYIRRGIRKSVFDTQDPFPTPIIRRRHTKEITERIDWAGKILTPIDPDEVRRAAKKLVRDKHLVNGKIESIAICLINSYVNPVHENKAAEILRKEFPEVFVTTSAEVAPEIREYERMSTVAYNAAIGRMFGEHLESLEKELAGKGLKVPLQIILSSGGTSGTYDASLRPVNSLFSGPAGGVMSARYLDSLISAPNIISVDMGGTSFDVGVIRNGEAETSIFSQVADYPVLGERIQIHSIGAGGGSIAWVDEQGILKVGPQSSGADPGPACYNLGGTEATVTDANVVLGYIDPEYFLGGSIKLNPDRSMKAIKNIARKAGITPIEAAIGIIRIVNNNMVNAMRLLTVERGYDPRDFMLVAFGGAGPLHAAAIYEEIGAKGLIVPLNASVFSAFGMLVTKLKHSYSRTYKSLLHDLDLKKANELMTEMRERAKAVLSGEGVADSKMCFEASTDMSYEGQIHELNVPVSSTDITASILEEAKESLAKKYEALYGFREQLPAQVVTFRLNGTGESPVPLLKKYSRASADSSGALKASRKACFEEKGVFVKTPVYDGLRIRPGNKIAGPAIVEYPTTTLVILHGQKAAWDEWLNAIIS